MFIAMTFIFSMVVPPQASYAQMVPQTVLNLPIPGTMVPVTPGFTPTLVKGITIHPDNPLMFDFIVDNGDENLSGEELKKVSKKLIKYFLASLTVPEDDLWVNLSPYEQDRIIPEGFGDTEMGRDLLAMDYMLKQLTSSLMYPEDELGKKFWKRVYAKAYEKYGTTEIPVNTFNKVWIVPEKASVYEHENSAFVVESKLKVMLEEDYLALQENLGNTQFGLDQMETSDAEVLSSVSSDIVKEILIPEIEKEVNKGETFANLRQIYNSMILAAWYKLNLQESLLGQVYANQNKTAGVDTSDKQINQKIYDQYVDAFSKGVYNYIREDYDETTSQIIPRKYFSGGFKLGQNILAIVAAGIMGQGLLPGNVEASMDSRQDDMFRIGAQVIEKTGNKIGEEDGLLDFVIKTEGVVTLKPLRAQLASLEEQASSSVTTTGVSYDVRMEEEDILKQVQVARKEGLTVEENFKRFKVAKDYIKTLGKFNVDEFVEFVEVIESTDISFGLAVIQEEGVKKIIIERAFLMKIQKLGNPYDMLTRTFVYALSEGTHEEKRVVEFEYARKVFGDEKLGQELDGDVIGNFYNWTENEMLSGGVRDERLAQEMIRKFKESFWEIGVHMMNGDIHKSGRIRWNESDPEFNPNNPEDDSGDTSGVMFALAGNPLHFGQLETPLRQMAQQKKSQVGFVLQGEDSRKELLKMTQEDRHDIFAKRVSEFFPGFFFYSGISKGTPYDGETQVARLLKMNQGRKGSLKLTYLVGTDHMHLWAPSDKLTDSSGNRLPKLGSDGKPQLDTVLKLFNLRDENQEIMQENKQILEIAFNTRDPEDGIPMAVEEEELKRLDQEGFFYVMRGLNIEGASSTKIRNALAGLGSQKDLTILPISIENEIRQRGKYRGNIINLPPSIQRLVKSNKKMSRNDGSIVKEDFVGLVDDVDSLWEVLIDNEYIFIESEKEARPNPGNLTSIDKVDIGRFNVQKEQIFDVLKKATGLSKLRRWIQVEQEEGRDVSPERIALDFNLSVTSIKSIVKFATASSAITETEEKVKKYAQGKFIEFEKDYPFSFAQSFEAGRKFSIVYDESYTLEIAFDDLAGKVRAEIKMLGISTPEESFYNISLEGDAQARDEETLMAFIDMFFEKALSVKTNVEIHARKRLSEIIKETGRDDMFTFTQFRENEKDILFMSQDIGNQAVRISFDDQKGEAVAERGQWKAGEGVEDFNPLKVPLEGANKTEDTAKINKLIDGLLIASSSALPLGGINLDPKLLDLQIKRDGNGVPLPVWQQPIEQMNIEGFVPVIINIELIPFSQVPLLLGLTNGEAPSNTANDSSSEALPDAVWMLNKQERFAVIES